MCNPNAMLPGYALAWLAPRLAQILDGAVVELGSGHGTDALAALLPDGVRLVSVEHDERWLRVAKGTTYIHAPLEGGWYARAPLAACLPPRDQIRALVVDGPPSRGRAGLLQHLDLFPPDMPILIDDAHRPEEVMLAQRIAAARELPWSLHHLPGDPPRAFATVGWPVP